MARGRNMTETEVRARLGPFTAWVGTDSRVSTRRPQPMRPSRSEMAVTLSKVAGSASMPVDLKVGKRLFAALQRSAVGVPTYRVRCQIWD